MKRLLILDRKIETHEKGVSRFVGCRFGGTGRLDGTEERDV